MSYLRAERRFRGPKPGPAGLRIEPNPVRCLSFFFDSALLEQLDAAEQCKYAKKTVKKRLLERVRAPTSASFRTSSQMVQREWHSHGVHWTAATGRTLLFPTSVVSRLRNLANNGGPKSCTDSVVPESLFGSFVAKRETNISATESARFVFSRSEKRT